MKETVITVITVMGMSAFAPLRRGSPAPVRRDSEHRIVTPQSTFPREHPEYPGKEGA